MDFKVIENKIENFEQFIENKLKSDLKDVDKRLAEKSSQCKEWTELKTMILTINEFNEKDNDMNVQVELGENIKCFGKISEFEMHYIDLGLGYLLEMNRDEALKYADIRLRLLQKEINHLRELSVNIKAHIKLTLLAIGELQTTINK